MDLQPATELLQRYLDGNANPKEVKIVEEWYRHLSDNNNWYWALGERELLAKTIETRLLQSINEERKVISLWDTNLVKSFSIRFRWVAAAAIILFISAAYFLFSIKNREVDKVHLSTRQLFKNDVAPGKNGAVLTLANGTKISLDSAANGTLGIQGNASILNNNGQISYNSLNEKPITVLFNTLTTQRGNQYQLVLPDGSHVWLNAASSITYPTVFTGNERRITMSGEAYFEITKNAKLPFIVQKGDVSIKVLGTHFNVNAYDDEDAMKTTLLEGKIAVSKGVNSNLLTPGQQAVMPNNLSKIQIIDDANIEETMAWKNDIFKFTNASIESVMLQVSRWYDLDVVYKTKVTHHFVAEIPRNVPLSELLRLLELTDQVHFKIEGRKVIVIP